jgi:catechol 2,3-dioxygenase-like lactoylglutathione lyase family enzyme
MTTAVETHPSTLTAPALTGLQHIGLTVRDIVASEAWYTNVLGLVRAFVEPHATGEGYAVVMTHPSTGLFVGLDHHPDADREMFSPLRTGLDHVALGLASREAIDEWIAHLDTLGVDHEAVFESAEPAPHALVVFRDPDGIPIELFWYGGETAGQPHLPLRAGSRPRTSTELPHCQLDQQPEDSRHVDAILAEASRWPSVLAGPSAISVEGARALMLDAGTAAGPKEAFMVGQEFCHVHAQGDFSLHAALPLPLAAAAEHSGWAEPHFLAHTGQAPATIVMLYAPRDRAEQDVVLGLVRASYEYALNQQPAV